MSAVQEKLVSKFATLLGTKHNAKAKANGTYSKDVDERELLKCLSKHVESHEVICTLPSLDMKKVEEAGAADPLPEVGAHFHVPSKAGAAPGGARNVPKMAASVLNNNAAADASAKAAQLEQKAAQSLGSVTSWTKSSVTYASSAVAKNVSDSFSSLVDSRVRAWTLLLLRHSVTTGDAASRSRLLSMLSSIIKVTSAETGFKTLSLPASAMGQPKEADVILPLLFEVDLNITIQQKEDKVTLRAPGTILGNLDEGSESVEEGDEENMPGLKKVQINIDTGKLLDSMVEQARLVVFKAVAKATAATNPSAATVTAQMKAGGSGGGSNMQPPQDPMSQPSSALSGFSSALNLSSGTSVIPESHPVGPDGEPIKLSEPQHRLQKARASALRLSSVLQGGTSDGSNPPLDKTRKTRSIQWDHPMDLPKVKSTATPSPKRMRVAQTSARLKSFKSFGRPHAGDFGSGPRNATFNNFGRGPIWGRDGKLANHPQPMRPEDQSSMFVSGSETNKNATFDDFQRPKIHLSSVGLGSSNLASKGLAASRNRGSMSNVPTSIPRTATALESWLLKSSTGGN